MSNSIVNMTSWMKNQIANLYKAVSAPVASTRDALADKLQSIHDTTYLLCKIFKYVVRIKEMYKKNFEREPWFFKYVPDQNKTQVMCERA